MRKTVAPSKRDFARKLRNNATREENRVWYDCLKRLPYTFQRQKPFGDYIVDFFCAEAGLIIEIDGSQHYTEEALEYDKRRDDYLRNRGFEVLRISNYDVNTNFDGVFYDISGLLERMTGKDRDL